MSGTEGLEQQRKGGEQAGRTAGVGGKDGQAEG